MLMWRYDSKIDMHKVFLLCLSVKSMYDIPDTKTIAAVNLSPCVHLTHFSLVFQSYVSRVFGLTGTLNFESVQLCSTSTDLSVVAHISDVVSDSSRSGVVPMDV